MCDLTLSFCDINCCCDDACKETDKLLFDPPCQTEKRMFMNNDIEKWFCDDTLGNAKIHEPAWFPIICVNVSFVDRPLNILDLNM